MRSRCGRWDWRIRAKCEGLCPGRGAAFFTMRRRAGTHRNLMNAIAVLVEAEVSRFPDNVGHVLGSRRLRSYQSLAGRLTYLAWKGRDVLTGGATYCRKLVSQPEKSSA